MIYYYSGTGNTAFVANELAELLSERCFNLSTLDASVQIFGGKELVFVFPVYSWGIPPIVENFIINLPYSFINILKDEKIPVFIVMTCGDEVGKSAYMISKILMTRGLKTKSIWSVIMPNNYVLLPGFDVDSRSVEEKKLNMAPKRVEEIADGIRQGKEIVDVVEGSWAWLKSGLIYPLFKRWGIFPRKWHPTDACVGCGICVRMCPVNNIRMSSKGLPEWGMNCCSCVACYHSCPRHAVEYGNITKKKGQYLHPGFMKKRLI